MKAASLLVPRVTADPQANLDRIEGMVSNAGRQGAKLVVLPEAILTGLTNNDNPEHDLPLGQPIPGPATDRLGPVARQAGLWLGLGLLERDGDSLYNTAILIGPDGSVALRYRRFQPHWHGIDANPAVYRHGTSMDVTRTPFGTVGFLICGDLFDDDVVLRFRAKSPGLLLFPFARCFSDGSADQTRWDHEELPEYARRVAFAKAPALMVNYIGDPSLEKRPCFGGAYAVSAKGKVEAALPLGVEGTLAVDLDRLMG